jgi:hypothetical protein
MRTFAFCAASFKESVAKAAGVRPLLSPPVEAFGAQGPQFNPRWMSGYDFIYFKLHGMVGQPFWYGDDWLTAITAEQIQSADLTRAIVFVANCNTWHPTRPDSPEHQAPMLWALLQAGARAVVAGPGQNYAKTKGIYSADLLGLNFRRFLQMFPIEQAFELAKVPVKLAARTDPRVKDALEFQLFDTKGATFQW